MSLLLLMLMLFAVAILAGLTGSLLGLGGGIIIVPVLTLALHLDIRYAIGASLVAVIATSCGSAAAYVREHLANLRVAMLLETATTCGALTGAFVAGVIAPRWLYVTFAGLLTYSALAMLWQKHGPAAAAAPADAWADRLGLHGQYFDEAAQETVPYRVARTPLGWALMYAAGIFSGLLGIGSGVLKVPTMDLAMRLPIKVSTATSNFMMGVTAAASAGVYFGRGDIDPIIAGPVALGVLLGATLGAKLLGRLQNRTIRGFFVVVLLWVSVQMLLRGIRG